MTATYRLHVNAGFTFAQAHAQLDYFDSLGVSHLYVSPILAARRGSMHGYDVVDPTRLNPELGSESDFIGLANALHERGMGLMVDIVPNHMGIGPENAYWDDVLAHGERSRFAKWFDIEWAAHPHRKLLLPILGDELDKVLARGELSVKVQEGVTPRVVYFGQSFPVDPSSLPPELQLATFDPEETGELADLFSGSAGQHRLRALLEVQHYQLAFWRRGPAEINYRRFFDVNDLAALRMEDEEVFTATHALVLRYVRDGMIDALRVDHIDGLLEPRAYLRRLREAAGAATPIVVEKILSPGESLRTDWPVQGTTGYEFLNDLEDVFLDPAGYADVETCYRRMRRFGDTSFHDIARAGKIAVLSGALRADVLRLASRLQPIARGAGKKWPVEDVAAALTEFMASLTVYRTYIDGRPTIDDADRELIDSAVRDARRHAPASAEIIGFIGEVSLGIAAGVQPDLRLAFVERLQQVSGPATAKGVEDTALYQYKPLASRNEVGGSPDRSLDDAAGRLHRANEERMRRWPGSLITTDTHDTKRSADVRARLDVISEMPREWERAVKRWRKLNAKHRKTVKGRMAPDTNAEYLLYQMLVALWPPPRAARRVDDLPDRSWRDAARQRLTQYMLKAAKEAKTRTSWVNPDKDYEQALEAFVAAVMEPSDDAPFLSDVARFVSRIALPAAWNSLSRVTLHLTSPGVADVYQGDELWNFALVDPDNRRPVDYAMRAKLLAAPSAAEPDPFDNQTKIEVTRSLLRLRRNAPEIFSEGIYRPLTVRGKRGGHVVAFAIGMGSSHVVTVAGRLLCTLAESSPNEWWGDTEVELPPHLQGMEWKSQFASRTIGSGPALSVASLFTTLPAAVLAN
ncbi:MAG TPA: malto-oligosyltrehalose synthase [Gemmatimonadaceae bacterium]|nr:malto-oligosyltrehalose synthase [Gemmatimonadaceae bacterium]